MTARGQSSIATDRWRRHRHAEWVKDITGGASDVALDAGVRYTFRNSARV
jgi:hypothetical protein